MVLGYAVVTLFIRLDIAEPFGLPYAFWLGGFAFLVILFLIFGLA